MDAAVGIKYRQLNFDRAARSYDAVSSVQRVMARRLVELLPACEPRHVLELGAGTGHLSTELTRRLGTSRLLVTDIAPGMLEKSRQRLQTLGVQRLHCLELDASAPAWRLRARFDLVASNAMVQWFGNLHDHMLGVACHLRSCGHYLVSGFLPENLPELASALAHLDVAPRIGHSEALVLEAARAAGLELLAFESDSIEQNYRTARTFFDAIRRMGASRYPATRPLSRAALHQLVADYEQRYRGSGGVSATWRPWYALLASSGAAVVAPGMPPRRRV